MFTDDYHIGKSKELSDKLLETIELRTVAELKINKQKSMLFQFPFYQSKNTLLRRYIMATKTT